MSTLPQYWLMKSEPVTYGIEHLKADRKTAWTGVRNFQARNYIRDGMQVGDQVLFYHSNCKEPGVYGIAKVASKAYPDPTQFDPKSDYYDARATTEKPIWMLVDIAYVSTLPSPVLLSTLRQDSKLTAMMLLQPGSRLSITPVDDAHFDHILTLGS